MILQGVSELACMELQEELAPGYCNIQAYLDRLCHDISDWYRQTAPGLVLRDIHRSALLCHLDCEKETENDFEKKITHIWFLSPRIFGGNYRTRCLEN